MCVCSKILNEICTVLYVCVSAKLQVLFFLCSNISVFHRVLTWEKTNALDTIFLKYL